MARVEPLTGKRSDLRILAGNIAELAAAIGSERFIEAFMNFAAAEADADFISIFCLDDQGNPLMIGTRCRLGGNRAERAALGYGRHFAEDVNIRIMRDPERKGDFATYQRRADIAAFPYRRDCYDRPGIADRASVIRKGAGFCLAVSLYRAVEAPPFEPEEQATIGALAPMIIALVERHVAFGRRERPGVPEQDATRLALAFPDLTERQRQIAALSIRGLTAAQIAARLGLSETTVITHRKRTYRRLGVANLRELLRL